LGASSPCWQAKQSKHSKAKAPAWHMVYLLMQCRSGRLEDTPACRVALTCLTTNAPDD
jgi:hypothetical protein